MTQWQWFCVGFGFGFGFGFAIYETNSIGTSMLPICCLRVRSAARLNCVVLEYRWLHMQQVPVRSRVVDVIRAPLAKAV